VAEEDEDRVEVSVIRPPRISNWKLYTGMPVLSLNIIS